MRIEYYKYMQIVGRYTCLWCVYHNNFQFLTVNKTINKYLRICLGVGDAP